MMLLNHEQRKAVAKALKEMNDIDKAVRENKVSKQDAETRKREITKYLKANYGV